MGVMLCAGGSLRWFRDNFCGEEINAAKKKKVDPYQLIIDRAKGIAPGSEGLVFLPYLTGERTPYPDPSAKGVFFGLTIRHRKEHLIRSVLEGISFGLADSLEIIRELKVPISEVRASGGGALSTFWRQLLADVFDSEMVTVNVSEGGAFGVALLAGVGSKVFKSVQEACDKTIKLTSRLSPDKENTKAYRKYYGVYRDLYGLLKEEFRKL
jgi:xylulokinase